jgi:hypothetical protein
MAVDAGEAGRVEPDLPRLDLDLQLDRSPIMP